MVYAYCQGTLPVEPSRGIYQSVDGGMHWTRWSALDGLFGVSVPNAIAPPTISSIRVFPDPGRPLVIYAAVNWSVDTREGPDPIDSVSGMGLAKSVDGGITFTPVSAVNPAVGAVTQMAFAGNGAVYLVAGLPPEWKRCIQEH